ncbi:deoxyguanosinetriphosphate triphosphohydrolase [Algihabitans albus]|uniref:deoxyguanosinetriphosphate triphosphohydrolase n=1 Tax=Algihabitans albus TaxID=2164067 RepID=UPI000E5D47DE|nr:deoxyguanosinetriphosphate triphosphohydrolase [Algihabitans albus]
MTHPEPRPPAPYACDPAKTRGRRLAEPESPTRTAFQRDRDRIVHSGAFRKLQYKTQVFVYHEGDYYRTRLTHSLEVAQIARSISRQLGLNEDLAEAVALAHDLGHTPFGHAGEDALDGAMQIHGGFDHNEQTFRILTELEARYADFDGLNLTWETLEGAVKHNGPLAEPRPHLATFCEDWDLELNGWPSAEAQVAALADDIAYNNHDIDDGLRAGLFTIDDLMELPLVGPVFEEVQALYPRLELPRWIHETIRRLINLMVEDLLGETRLRLTENAPKTADDIRTADRAMVAFSETMRQNDRVLRDFLFTRMYRHYLVNRQTLKARRVVSELFELYMDQPNTLPAEWRQRAETAEGPAPRARIVADYIAGMTDRYALEAHRKVFDPYVRF